MKDVSWNIIYEIKKGDERFPNTLGELMKLILKNDRKQKIRQIDERTKNRNS